MRLMYPEEEQLNPQKTPQDGAENMPEEDAVGESLTPSVEPAFTEPVAMSQQDRELDELRAAAQRAREEIGKLVVGQDNFIDLLIATLLAGGHLLVEGVPGIAKTLTARLLAKTVDAKYSRIQFTPDLMPSDVTGTTVFNMSESKFTFNPGPVFANVILIDEINRAPAKTQAALFEVMEENQVTIDGNTYPMDTPFFVIATQNPIEQEGTYKLPEAQLDRFLARVVIDYPNLEDEQQILRRFRSDFQRRQEEEVTAVFSAEEIAKFRSLIEQVYIKDELLDYIAAIVHRTRAHADLYLGASPRASLAILRLSKAYAALGGRSFVTPDDIQLVAYPVLNHRIILTPEREMEGYSNREVIREIVKSIEVPR